MPFSKCGDSVDIHKKTIEIKEFDFEVNKAPKIILSENYNHKKLNEAIDKLQGLLSEFSLNSETFLLEKMRSRLEENRMMKLAFVGRFNSGKSSLINAFLNIGQTLPIGLCPTTKSIYYMFKGENDSIYYENASGEIVCSDKLSDLKENQEELKNVREISVALKDYP